MESTHGPRTVRFGLFELDLTAGELRRNGRKIKLQEQPFQILSLLLEHPGDVVTPEQIIAKLWLDGTVVEYEHSIRTAVKKLRQALSDDADTPRYVETLPRRGYRFIASVNGADVAASVKETRRGKEIPTCSTRWFRWTTAIVSLVALTAATLFTLNAFKVRDRFLGSTSVPRIQSLAVLPLANLSGDPAQEYFSDGMTDALITDLSQIASLKVISRTSVMHYKKTDKTLPEIARELNVDGIVEGTVQRSGDHVRITAQLIHGRSDKHLWANSYERDMRDAFALERDVSEDVARQVQARLTTQNQMPLPQPRPTNVKALEAYLQGNYHLNRYGRGFGVEEKGRAAEYFQQAIDADRNFAPAYVGLANAHDDLPVSSRGDLEVMRKGAEQALALDPNSSEAWGILAGLRGRDFDWTGAEQGYRHAIGLNPNNAETRDRFCSFLAEMGRLDEALQQCQIAQELDPNNDHLSSILYWRGEYDRAIAMLRMVIERHPEESELHYSLFGCDAKKQSYKEAVEELERTLTLYGLSDTVAKIHQAFATSGYRGAIRAAAQEWEHLQQTKQFSLPVNIADLYATLGDKDRAFYWLDQAYTNRDTISSGEGVSYIKVDPMLEPLRSDPRFKDLVRRVGLPP